MSDSWLQTREKWGFEKRIVFTNGCFDLFHVGHLHCLRRARSFGDVLVVGVNSDASIRRLKGTYRPFVSEGDRVEILSALRMVDVVTVFDSDTPIELIQAIRPDVLVKGGDYSPDQVVGRDFVESYGGRVEIIPLIPDRSTTKLQKLILSTLATSDRDTILGRG